MINTSLQDYFFTLFMTRGSSLSRWSTTGILDREIVIYRKFQPYFREVKLVSYGNGQKDYSTELLSKIKVINNLWKLPQYYYIRFLVWFAPLLWRGPTIFKSNQAKGAEVALSVASRLQQPFVARCGYLYSYLIEQRTSFDSPSAKKARELEKFVFSNANSIIVTTNEIRELIVRKYQLSEKVIHVIPNYVDTSVFYPAPAKDSKHRICYVGRLHEEKNLIALFDAVTGLNVELTIVGSGQLNEQLEQKAIAQNMEVQFLGRIPNSHIPNVLNNSDVFILPSFYEGHPKSLLEAMACGLPVIGTDVVGIRELIEHRTNGYLCGTSSEEIRYAIKDVLGNHDLQKRMGNCARSFILENFSLEIVFQKELKIYEKIINA